MSDSRYIQLTSGYKNYDDMNYRGKIKNRKDKKRVHKYIRRVEEKREIQNSLDN